MTWLLCTLRPPSAATARADAKRQVKDPDDKHTKAEARLTCPARCAIAALLPSPNGNESACLPACLPAASPAHHFVSHLHNPPGAPPASDSPAKPSCCGFYPVQIITPFPPIIFPLLEGPGRPPEPISSVHLSTGIHPTATGG